MRLRGVVSEDFCNYKKPSMFLISAECDWKCCKEAGKDVSICQNAPLLSAPVTDIPNEQLVKMYLANDITQAIVVGGLEPMLQIDELDDLLTKLRESGCEDPFVVYTGYYPEEIPNELSRLRGRGVIVKFGRFLPDRSGRFDELLGVPLVSENQYAVELA